MYRILIVDKDNKNEFYMVDKDTIYEGNEQQVTAKTVELMDIYPLSKLNIVENSIEIIDVEINEEPQKVDFFLEYTHTYGNLVLDISVGKQADDEQYTVFIHNRSSSIEVTLYMSEGNFKIKPNEVIKFHSTEEYWKDQEFDLYVSTWMQLPEFTQSELSTQLNSILS